MQALKMVGRRESLTIAAALSLLLGAAPVIAGPGGGGAHGGGGFHPGGGGYYRGGWGHGGYYGWHGYHGGYGGWGWGCCGWGLGIYLPALPLGYQTFWWDDVPYYYADNNYYLWDHSAGQFLQVEPPANLAATSPSGASPEATLPSYGDLFAYPKARQSEEQQTRDRQECRQWTTSQTGIDPTVSTSSRSDLDKRQSYLRAEAACLEGRDYSVK